MRTALALALLLATPAVAAPADDVAKLAWMAGTWIQEKDAVTTRETWLAPLDGAMAGAGQTNRPGRPPSIEHMKITAEPAGAAFIAILPGQPPTPFVLKPGPDGEATFENPTHDFPNASSTAAAPPTSARVSKARSAARRGRWSGGTGGPGSPAASLIP